MSQISCITRKLTTTWVTSWMSFFLCFVWPESPTSATIYSFFKCEEGTLKNISSSYSPGPNVYILMFMISSWSSCLNVETKLKFWGKCDTIEDHLTTWVLNKMTVEVSAPGLWLLQTQSFNKTCSSRHWLPPVKLHNMSSTVQASQQWGSFLSVWDWFLIVLQSERAMLWAIWFYHEVVDDKKGKCQ